MFQKSAAYYDLLYRDLKDYATEAAHLDRLIQQISPGAERLLDVACGTGEHARHLSEDHGYRIDGADIEAGFVEIARKKLPQATFQVSPMQTLQMDKTYDAVLCLFSALGYVETLEGLAAAAQSFARHLKPGGWLICEPWTSPDDWISEQQDSVEAVDPQTGKHVKRTRHGSTEGMTSVITIDYEISEGETVERLREIHRLGLFTEAQTNHALRDAGLEPTWIKSEHAADLLIAQKA